MSRPAYGSGAVPATAGVAPAIISSWPGRRPNDQVRCLSQGWLVVSCGGEVKREVWPMYQRRFGTYFFAP
ncbi:hypothetical protein KCP71_24150 [Salmonella enterica subsp. enterica]|nr:hypothetical protein KCP71_24150 [Salmonella enterica subsp. enterica]